MWGSGRSNWWINLIIIGAIFLVVMNVWGDWGFPWWILFFVWPVFGGWRHNWGEQRRDGKLKREPRVYDAEMEKPKREPREPRYALGDDGELIELPPDEDDTIIEDKRKRSDYI